jgi:hypothetical protein
MNFITSYCRIHNWKVNAPSAPAEDFPTDTLEHFQLSLYEKLNPAYPKFYKMDSQSRMGFLASEILLKDSNFEMYSPESIAVILSNSNSSLDTDLKYVNSAAKGAASPALFVYTLPNIVTGEICIRHRIKGENAFFIMPEFDHQLITSYVDQILNDGDTEACLAGWIDVVEEAHDVFLYLVEKKQKGLALGHTSGEVRKLYSKAPWNS